MAAQHQHYVPQLLLRGFLSRDRKLANKDQVHVFDIVEKRQFTPSVGNIMGERRFNEFWIDEETLISIEDSTSRIESHVAPLIENIRTTKRLNRTLEEKSDLALLMAFQFIRTKKMRLLPERLNNQLVGHVKKMGLDPKNVDGIFDYTNDDLKKEHIRHQAENMDVYTSLIFDKEFFLALAPKGRSFYIGDHPVVLHNDDEKGLFRGSLGLGVPFIQIYLPLSSDVLLCAYDKAILGQMMMLHDEGLKELQVRSMALMISGSISAAQMKANVDNFNELSPTKQFIAKIRRGEAVTLDGNQIRLYNSLQVLQAHRFLIDPDGRFEVAKEVIRDRVAS